MGQTTCSANVTTLGACQRPGAINGTSFGQDTIGSDSAVRDVVGHLVGELTKCATGQRGNDPIRGRAIAVGI